VWRQIINMSAKFTKDIHVCDLKYKDYDVMVRVRSLIRASPSRTLSPSVIIQTTV
jgi:hypothetical protein